jgi:arylsulfatase A
MLNIKLQKNEVLNSEDMLDVMLGKSPKGRTVLVEQGLESLSIVQDNRKYIEPNHGSAMDMSTNTELAITNSHIYTI